MTEEEVQEIANENNLDDRALSDVHYRLLDSYGNYKFDVYFKHNKKGGIKWNTILKWETQRWFKINSEKEFLALL